MSKQTPQVLSEEEIKTLSKLQEILAQEEMEIFDKEVEIIRKMIKIYQGFAAMGLIGTAAKNIVMWIGIMLGAYFAFTEFIVKFIKTHSGG